MSAKRIALLLDIGFGSLRASARSAARMAACLEARSFSVHTLAGPEVTRANVERTLGSLHAGLADGDAFVLYFVGHGDKVRGVTAPAPAGQLPASTETMLLITHDLLADAALPGIAGPELTRWLAPLVRRTGNVTLILDCCRAATLVPGEIPDDAALARITEILTDATPALHAKYRAHRDAPPTFVRLVATTRNESAVEYEPASGRIGVFTDALAQLLERHPDDTLSWDQLLPDLQAAVQAECETQYPGVEGPRHRLPFSRREQPVPGEYPCRADNIGWIAEAGALHGIEVGDRFDLAPDAVATRVDPYSTQIKVTRAPRPGTRRTRRIACARPQVIRCDHLPSFTAPELRFTTDDDPDAIATITGETLRERDDIIHIGDAGLLDAARRLARWRRQAPVFTGLTAHALAHVAWGVHDQTVELPHDGVALPAGTRVWLRASAAETHPTVQVSLFRLRADRHLVHLDDELDHGVTIARNSTTDLSPRTGLSLTWSPQVPADGPRDEALYLLVSTRPRGFHRVGTTPSRPRELIASRVTRGVGPEIAVIRLAYRLSPSA